MACGRETLPNVFDLDRIAAGLPVGGRLDELAAALTAPDARLVVQAPPGSGKTTVVPPLAAHHHAGRVVVTQPRRIAARAAAHRLAELSGTALGREVGFTVRGESRRSDATRVEFVTTGVLVNRVLRDPELAGVGTVILDEVHERRLDTDLAFAMVHDVADLRDDLALIAMSATLDAQRWASLLGTGTPAPVVDVPGALFPLSVEWAPPPSGVLPTYGGHLDNAFAAHLARVTAATLAQHHAADGAPASALVFVPGARDVDQLIGLLRHEPGLAGDIEVAGLYGSMAAREQDAVLRGGGRPRVIVSTAVAESSLTVPGVRIVVDAGLSREPRLDATRGVTGLVTVRESRASADQRAGRAARLGPGVAVRCFARDEWAGMSAEATAEASVSDLAGAALTLACWGSARGQGMTLPDPLPSDALDRAIATLRGLGALDARERPTALGRRLSTLPLDPRLGRALLVGAARIGPSRAGKVMAMLASDERVPDGDLMVQWRALSSGRSPAARRWRHEATRLERMARGSDGRPGSASGAPLSDQAAVGLLAALARPDWIARRREPGGRAYLTASGTGVDLLRESSLVHSEWLAISELTRLDTRTGPARAAQASGSLVRAATALGEQTALDAGADLLDEQDTATWDPATGRVQTRRQRALGAIVLSSTPVRTRAAAAAGAALAALPQVGLGIDEPGLLRWSDGAVGLRNRLAFLHSVDASAWPDVSQPALVARADTWLARPLHTTGSTFDVDVTTALRTLLDWRQLAELDRAAPERLPVPTGSQVRVRYPSPESGEQKPVLAVKLQECFGMRTTPRVSGVPVLMELLSPARRPLAITDDLESFWVNVYPQVRAENRRRYAKHPWPEDPLTAPPRRGTTRSGR